MQHLFLLDHPYSSDGDTLVIQEVPGLLLQGSGRGGGGPEAVKGHAHAGTGARTEWGSGKRRFSTYLMGDRAEGARPGRNSKGLGAPGNIRAMGSIGTIGQGEYWCGR